MKALKSLVVLLLFLGGIFSCHKKDYPKPLVVENSAVYYSNLVIDNTPVLLQAGVDGYYMYSSYKVDSNSVYNYVADLKKTECSNCTQSLKIQINDYKLSTSGATKIDSALSSRNYPYMTGNPEPSYSAQFVSLPDNTAYYLWNFGDGTTTNEQNPKHEFQKAAHYPVCLTTTATNGYVNTICNTISIGNPATVLNANISSTSTGSNSIYFNANAVGGTKPYHYLWTLSDGKTSQQDTFSHTFTYRGSSSAVLRVIDATGDTVYRNYNVKTLSDNSSHLANYTLSAIEKGAPSLDFSKVTISWIAADGLVYTSNDALQPQDSFFQILTVSEGESNEKGETTKKITAKFKCRLYNGTRSIMVNDAEVVICVAYKN